MGYIDLRSYSEKFVEEIKIRGVVVVGVDE